MRGLPTHHLGFFARALRVRGLLDGGGRFISGQLLTGFVVFTVAIVCLER